MKIYYLKNNFFRQPQRSLRDDLVSIFLLLFFAIFYACAESDQIDLTKMESSGTIPLPSEAPNQWLLAHIDVETTGLLPGYHEMIDIGIVMTDLDGDVLDSLFLRIQPQHPERLSQKAFEVNAFDPHRWIKLGALLPSVAVDSIISFHTRVAQNKHVLMVAYNSHFDAAFLDHLFRSAHKTWRELYYYFILDIPSMAWGLGFKDLTSKQIMDYYDVPDEPHVAEQHTGITGAMVNVRIYRALLRYRKELLR
jgi:DNA polymerase III alpha subunit (gram-positive type)